MLPVLKAIALSILALGPIVDTVLARDASSKLRSPGSVSWPPPVAPSESIRQAPLFERNTGVRNHDSRTPGLEMEPRSQMSTRVGKRDIEPRAPPPAPPIETPEQKEKHLKELQRASAAIADWYTNHEASYLLNNPHAQTRQTLERLDSHYSSDENMRHHFNTPEGQHLTHMLRSVAGHRSFEHPDSFHASSSVVSYMAEQNHRDPAQRQKRLDGMRTGKFRSQWSDETIDSTVNEIREGMKKGKIMDVRWARAPRFSSPPPERPARITGRDPGEELDRRARQPFLSLNSQDHDARTSYARVQGGPFNSIPGEWRP